MPAVGNRVMSAPVSAVITSPTARGHLGRMRRVVLAVDQRLQQVVERLPGRRYHHPLGDRVLANASTLSIIDPHVVTVSTDARRPDLSTRIQSFAPRLGDVDPAHRGSIKSINATLSDRHNLGDVRREGRAGIAIL